MPSTHVWLLDRGGPETESQVRPWLERVARDPRTSPLPGVLIFLLAWVWSHWAARRVIPVCRQLGAPSPQLSDVREQARALQRLLGRRYQVHPVFRHGGEGPSAAKGALGKGDQVVLLPLHPQRHPNASGAALADAWKTLAGSPQPATAIEGWGQQERLMALLAQRVREALIELSDAGRAGLVFASAAPPKMGTPAADNYLSELAETATRLRSTLGFSGPTVQAWIPALSGVAAPKPDVASAIQVCIHKGAQAIIVVPLGCTTSWPELRTCRADTLESQTQAARVRVLTPLAPSAEFARILAALVREAEREAGWSVPEDAIQADVEAELRASGYPIIPGGNR